MKTLKLITVLLFCWSWIGCGVKGDPLPPEKEPRLGRGRPNYKRATKDFKLPNLPDTVFGEEEDDDDDDEKEKDEE